jgi:hypothetical protein
VNPPLPAARRRLAMSSWQKVAAKCSGAPAPLSWVKK